jgi:hypothetical protein
VVLPGSEGRIPEASDLEDGRVIDKAKKRTQTCRTLQERRNLVWLLKIRLQDPRAPAEGLHFSRRRSRSLGGLMVVNRNICAGSRAGPRASPADATASTRNQDELVLKWQYSHALFPFPNYSIIPCLPSSPI